jgi:hypothetical protein
MTGIEDLKVLMREAAGVSASAAMDEIQLQTEGMDEAERIALQRMVNTAVSFIRQCSIVTGNPAQTLVGVGMAVGTIVALHCPAHLKDRFIDALCDALRTAAEVTKQGDPK